MQITVLPPKAELNHQSTIIYHFSRQVI